MLRANLANLFALSLVNAFSPAVQSLSAQKPLQVPETVDAPEWKCNLEAWVSAPDLRASSIVPGAVRLVANGTDCKRDIVGWGVGLQFKERAMVKNIKNATELPTPPTQSDYGLGREVGYDIYDIYDDLSSLYGDPAFDYISGMGKEGEEYRQKIRNPNLWAVHGAERVVFNVTHALPIQEDEWVDDEWLQAHERFAVAVPNTNFPPLDHTRSAVSMRGQYDARHGMTATESIASYYVYVSLANGTSIHVDAGYTAFLPNPEPAHLVEEEDTWPKEYTLPSWRKEYDSEQEVGDNGYSPECDQGNKAEFSVSVDYASQEPITQGKNVTLDITLKRIGNGSEVPHALSMRYGTRQHYTWARGQLETEKEYENLQLPDGGKIKRQLDSWRAKAMLMVPTLESLERSRGHRFWLSDEFSATRKLNDTSADVHFQLEIPIAYDDMISFQRTFKTHYSTLEVTLITVFACKSTKEQKETVERSEPTPAEAKVRSDDMLWHEYSLDPNDAAIEHDRHWLSDVPSDAIWRAGHIPIIVKSAMPASERTLLHYMDPQALAPRLVYPIPRVHEVELPQVEQLPESENVGFAPLGVARSEEDQELRQLRYRSEQARRLCSRRSPYVPCGGSKRHAARVWQHQEAMMTTGAYVPDHEVEVFADRYFGW